MLKPALIFLAALTIGLGLGTGLAAQMRAGAPDALPANAPDYYDAISTMPISLPAGDGRRPVVLFPVLRGVGIDDALGARAQRRAGSRQAPLIETTPAPRPTPSGLQEGALRDAPMLDAKPRAGPQIAIVIDDVGFELAAADRAMALPGQVTLAILPAAPHAQTIARTAQARRQEVIVHLPMEPLGTDNPGPMAIRGGQSLAEIARRVVWSFARVPGAIGVNNHMGSKLTQDSAAMARLMPLLAERAKFFLDSRTTSASVAVSAARAAEMPALTRDVFLDNVRTLPQVFARLLETENRALEQGYAIAIGHPHGQTLAALRAWMPYAARRGFRFVTLSGLIEARNLGVASLAP